MTYRDEDGNTAPEGATHFDPGHEFFLKESDGLLMLFDGCGWKEAGHPDGAAHLASEYVVKL